MKTGWTTLIIAAILFTLTPTSGWAFSMSGGVSSTGSGGSSTGYEPPPQPKVEIIEPAPLPVGPQVNIIEPDPLPVTQQTEIIEPDPLPVTPNNAGETPAAGGGSVSGTALPFIFQGLLPPSENGGETQGDDGVPAGDSGTDMDSAAGSTGSSGETDTVLSSLLDGIESPDGCVEFREAVIGENLADVVDPFAIQVLRVNIDAMGTLTVSTEDIVDTAGFLFFPPDPNCLPGEALDLAGAYLAEDLSDVFQREDFVNFDDDSGVDENFMFEQTVLPGQYYIVVFGDAAASSIPGPVIIDFVPETNMGTEEED